MADDKTKRRAKEIKEEHALSIDPGDTKGRRRINRAMDALYAAGIELETPGLSDVAKGVASNALQKYIDHGGGRPVTPVEQTLNVVHKSVEESVASILEMIGAKRKEVEQAQEPTKQVRIQ